MPTSAPRFFNGNRYRIDSPLGTGVFGEVWKCWDEHLHRWVAVKIVIHSQIQTVGVWDEASVPSELSSPHILPILNADISPPDIPYFVSEVASGTLMDTLRGRPLNEMDARIFASHVLTGLSVVHRAGFTHNDIKPSNVFITPARAAQLGDFGCVSRFGVNAAGDVHICAPERLTGAGVTPASDLFAVGITFWGVVTGQYPHNPPGSAAAMKQAAPHISDQFIRIIRKATNPNPSKRFKDAATMQKAMARSSGSIRVQPCSPHPGHTQCFEVLRPKGRPTLDICLTQRNGQHSVETVYRDSMRHDWTRTHQDLDPRDAHAKLRKTLTSFLS